MKATSRSKRRLTNMKVRSMRPIARMLWWWLIQMIPIVRKLVT
jgi:hypothetical protein